jgi:hypothetical protein
MMWSHDLSVDGTQKLLTGVPIRRPLPQGARWRVGIEFSVAIAISDVDPFHLRARSALTGCDSLSPNGRDAALPAVTVTAQTHDVDHGVPLHLRLNSGN